MGTSGIAAGVKETLQALMTELEKHPELNAAGRQTGGLGLDHAEPILEVRVPGMPVIIYGKVTPDIAHKIVQQHLINRELVDEHMYDRPASDIIDPGANQWPTTPSRRTITMAYVQYCLICDGPSCNSSQSERIHEQIMKYVYDHDLEKSCQVVKTGCYGFCAQGPIVKVLPDEAFYVPVKPEDAADIVREHLLKGCPVERLMYREKATDSRGVIDEISFYRWQARIVLRNCGFIDPESVDEYLAREGYPTGKKWRFSKEVEADQKYVVCNADPHSIIESMAICGYTVGASRGYVYVRAEYPLAIKRLEKAIEGAGAFVRGEETALLMSIEGKRGMPVQRPPYPAVKGLLGKPTVINNVEMLGNIPLIVTRGGEWFAGIGTETSKGTKVFALTGNVNNSGLIEVPMGTTLRDIVFNIGAGIPGGKQFTVEETCGKCVPCRVGGRQIEKLLEKFADGEGSPADLEKMEEIGRTMISASLCGPGKTGPDSVFGLSSARCTNEDNCVFQKMMRATIGANSVDHCARLCYSSTVAGLAKAFGSGAMTNSQREVCDCDCVFITGSNTAEAHPVLSYEVVHAVKKGANLIIVDPRKIPLTRNATLHLQARSGTGIFIFLAMMNVILREGWADTDFIEARTENFDEFVGSVADITAEVASERSGVPVADIEEAARIYALGERAFEVSIYGEERGRSSIPYSMGITQRSNGTRLVLTLANLALLTGNLGKPSTGVNPLRGQANVQGACDLGALPNVLPGYQPVTDESLRRKVAGIWGVKELPDTAGLSVVEMVAAAEKGSVRAGLIMGENPMLSDPDSKKRREEAVLT